MQLDLDRELTDTELVQLGAAVKATYDLEKALRKILALIEKEDVDGAVEALTEAIDKAAETTDYGYGYPKTEKAKDEYGYPTPKTVARHLRKAVTHLDTDKPDFEKAKEAVTALLKRCALPEEYEKPKGKSMTIKALREEDGGVVVGGYLCLFGSPEQKDLGGDYFTPKTETWIDVYKSVPCLFHHGLDDTVGLAVVGRRVKAIKDEIGVFVEDWLDKSKKYWAFVKPLLEAEALYYSPGSAAHLVKREKDGELKAFPIVEDTMTPVPMQHRLVPIEQIKTLYKDAGLELPDNVEEPPSVDELKAMVDKLGEELAK